MENMGPAAEGGPPHPRDAQGHELLGDSPNKGLSADRRGPTL